MRRSLPWLTPPWIDVSGPLVCLVAASQSPIRFGKFKDELGLRASVGVANNKVFTKLGSDYKRSYAIKGYL